MSSITDRARALGVILPPAPRPSANYTPWRKSLGQLWISGQVSDDGKGGISGFVGRDVDLERAVAAARISGLRIVAQISQALGDDLDRIVQIVRISGYVQVSNEFSAIPQVIDGCSHLMVDIFGKARGAHSRTSVGVRRLPRNFAVECDAVVEYHE